MGRSPFALIKPEMLIWGRLTAQMKVEDVAHRLHVKIEKLNSWESGESLPTIKQLRQIARIYNQTFAAFYLPSPPKISIPIPKDYRRHAGTTYASISPELALDIRTSWERREIILDLYNEQRETPKKFTKIITLTDDAEKVGIEIRNLLGIKYEIQKEWKDYRIGFKTLRELIELTGVLVFQSVNVPISEIRGYSLSETILPVIVVNRKDSYSARSFTMMHELTHLLLKSGGLCDLFANSEIPPEELNIEVFCNHVAGASLIPKELLLKEPIILRHGKSIEWSDDEIDTLSHIYCVSREVIVRRLLIFGLTNSKFYEAKRHRYQQEIKTVPRHKGFVSPSINLVSTSGKPYVKAVLEAYYSERITSSDLTDYLGIRLKHLDKVINMLG